MIVLRYPQEGIWFLSPLHKFCYAKRGPLSGLVGEAMWKSWIKRETFNGNLMPKWKSRVAAKFMKICFLLLQIMNMFSDHQSISLIFQSLKYLLFSCSLSDVQDFTIHWTKPCSWADIKEPLRFSKVILAVIMDILVIVIMIIVILIIQVLDDDPLRRNSQVITTPIDHHQLQYPNSKELWKCVHLCCLKTRAWRVYWKAEVLLRYKGFARTMQFSHPPLVSLAGETDGRRHGTRNFASQDFFCTKMSSPPSHMMLSLPLRHNFASNLSHFVTNLMQNLGTSLAYIFVLWYYVIIVI